jgi:hypothetical protein
MFKSGRVAVKHYSQAPPYVAVCRSVNPARNPPHAVACLITPLHAGCKNVARRGRFIVCSAKTEADHSW